MRPVSSELSRIVRGSHRMCTRARVVTPGQTGTDPDGTEIPILAGDVEHDASADVRATLDMETDGTGWSTRPDGLITPYGAEIFVERGIVHGNGNREWVSQGYFRIEEVEQGNAPNGPLRISARDRMAGIIDARLLSPIQFNVGASVQGIVEYLVWEVYPSAQIVFDFDAAGTTLASPHVAEESRYEFLLDLATSLGKVIYWDYAGAFRMVSPPDPTEPVFTVDHGRDGVLVELARSISRDGVYNAVVAMGEVPVEGIPPVRAAAFDNNPASPTYWYGAYGKVPRFYSSPMITTSAQAKSAATAMLKRALGLPYTVDFTAVPHPGLEPLDPVRVRYTTKGTSGEVHVIESLTVPLLAEDPMEATTREQTIIVIGEA